MKKLCIFDFDGTLIESITDFEICCNTALTNFGFPTLSKEEYILCLGGDMDSFISKVLGANSNPENIKMVKENYLELYNASEKESTLPYPNCHKFLKKLQDNNILLAINSNRLNDYIMNLIEKFFPDIDFLSVKGLDTDYPAKPNPSGTNMIINKTDLNLDDVVYIGDALVDIETAQNANIDCIIVNWGYGDEITFNHEYPLKVVNDFLELYNTIMD